MRVLACCDVPDVDIADVVSGRAFSVRAPGWFYRDVDGVREIGITGVLLPNGDEALGYIGYDWIVDALDGADRVRLFIDSPGGVVHPLLERVMRRLRDIDSEAIVTGQCASAAYFIGRSCRRLLCDGVTTEVGGIGAYVLLWDFSESNRMKGFKPIKVRIGELKGIGAGGEYTQEEIDEIYRELSDLFDAYMSVLGEEYRRFGDGRVYTAVKALELGLVDGVLPATYTEGIAMSENLDENVVTGSCDEPVEQVIEDTAVEACCEERGEEVTGECIEEEKDREAIAVKLPVRRVSDDQSAEKLFYKLLGVYGSRSMAWSALERINQEAYMKLRNKLNF